MPGTAPIRGRPSSVTGRKHACRALIGAAASAGEIFRHSASIRACAPSSAATSLGSTGSGPMVEIAHTHVVPSARGDNSGLRTSPLASRYSRNSASAGMVPPVRVTRWPSGWHVDRHKRDDDDQDRIKRDFRDVETPTPPLLYTLLVHVRSPSVVNRPTGLRTISVPSNGSADPWRNLKCSESLPEPPVAPETLQQMSSWHGHPMQSEADIVLLRGCSLSPSSGCQAAAILRLNGRRGRRERSCVAGSL